MTWTMNKIKITILQEETRVLKKAILKSWNAGSYTATIQITGSAKAYLEGVKAARNIPGAEMLAGRNLLVYFFDKSNAADAVIIAVYG
jgi:hypothetical protein